MRHAYLGTEHILLGLARPAKSDGARFLVRLGVDLDRVRKRIEQITQRAAVGHSSPRDIPYTSRAKKAVEGAMVEARYPGDGLVRAEHLVVGVLVETKGLGAQVLVEQGVTLQSARASLHRDLAGVAPAAFRLEIDEVSTESIYEQIVSQIQEAVATGKLRSGDRLRTVRQLADELDIAPGTVGRAYVELERRGVVLGDGARGTRVAPKEGPVTSMEGRPETLVGLLRPVAVAAFHLGATDAELRHALEAAMGGILKGRGQRPEARG